MARKFRVIYGNLLGVILHFFLTVTIFKGILIFRSINIFIVDNVDLDRPDRS